MDKQKNDSGENYVNYQNEHEGFETSYDNRSIKNMKRDITVHFILIFIVFLTGFIVSILNIDIFQPLGTFGEFLRYMVGGVMIGYLIFFLKVFK